MKKTAITVITALLLVAGAFAQTQNGVVKTRGRMVNGKLVPGTLLSGATVQVDGRQAILVKDGKFSFPVNNGKYVLKSVSKQGYSLVDAEVCRQYRVSANPLQIVMETPEQQMQDKLVAERKIRRQLQDKLRKHEDEIEALREQNSITDEQYRNALQELYAKQESNERLIADMAKRYSELDYDQLDEFQRQVSHCIENGELARADSLLRSRGDMNTRIANLHNKQKVQQKEEEAIKQRQKLLEKSKEGLQNDKELIATDCYNFYQRFVVAHQNDSAAHYLELRAKLDTTNITRVLEAGRFYMEYMSDFEKAKSLYTIAQRQLSWQKEEVSAEAVDVYDSWGVLYFQKAEYQKAMDCLQKSIEIGEKYYGKNTLEVSNVMHNVGQVYFRQGDYKKAMESFVKSLEIRGERTDDNPTKLPSIYNDLGLVYYQQSNNEKALE
ncbi:MAG: tetratricopeptide repeat protein, partial [Bacteroidales bacterium]|nr:tetratricopeptide repeat protein [Bacteroidales bacterium]